jgi:hypothetical protein
MTECKCCYDEVDPENITYFCDKETGQWNEYYCLECYISARDRMWNNYIDSLISEKCKKSVAEYINRGLPLFYRDNAYPNITSIKYNESDYSNITNDKETRETVEVLNTKMKDILKKYENDESVDLSHELSLLLSDKRK